MSNVVLLFSCILSDISILPRVLLQVVELISGGAQIAVTNENKMHYLNLLAQYRLASQVRDEVEHFLKGKETGTAAVWHFFCQFVSFEISGNVHVISVISWSIAGLNELVPENLLAIFDENELEVCVMFIIKSCSCLKLHWVIIIISL